MMDVDGERIDGNADVMVKTYGDAVFLQETLWRERKIDLQMVKALLRKVPTAVHKTEVIKTMHDNGLGNCQRTKIEIAQ